MASFDDLAFVNTTIHDRGSREDSQRFCPDCNKVAQSITEDGKRCLICGCDLEVQNGNEQQTTASSQPDGNPNPRDLRDLVMRLLTSLGYDESGNESKRPASEEAITKLGSFSADQSSTIEVAIVVDGIKGEVIAIPANFGPCMSIPQSQVIIADPYDGATTFKNADDLNGKIVVMQRGGITFAQKILRAQEAGALAVIIVQTFDVWPYTMTDSTGEGLSIKIPAFMLSMKQGQGFVDFIRQKEAERSENMFAKIDVRRDARECVICQGNMDIGMKVTRMPCQHMFHWDCLTSWLKIGNSCPICRVEIASKHPSRTHTGSAQHRGDFSWSDWFS